MKLGEEKCKKGKSSPGLNQYVWQMQYLRQVCDKYQKNHLLFHSNEKIAVLLQFACLMLTSGVKLGLQSKLSEPPNGRNHGQNCLASPPSQAGRIHFYGKAANKNNFFFIKVQRADYLLQKHFRIWLSILSSNWMYDDLKLKRTEIDQSYLIFVIFLHR